jgi:hypothetical protein
MYSAGNTVQVYNYLVLSETALSQMYSVPT